GVWAQLRAVEAGGGLRAPGGSVLLSCWGSGFNFEYYSIQRYHQTSSGSLKWVSHIGADSSDTAFGPAMEGRTTASRNNSQAEVSLSLRALLPQDSARYFCTIHTG
ncbi:HV01 protein, partial [Alectura lathami]|nr:HV01 protein [Alectura lathami]